jgi:hypothetical protein
MPDAGHDTLFAKYVEDLEWAIGEAVAQRGDDLVRREELHGDDRARAQESLEAHGPLYADPYIIGAVREYWLECDALNRANAASAVEPHQLILDWLRRDRPDLASVIERFPYWPIGVDRNGRWV